MFDEQNEPKEKSDVRKRMKAFYAAMQTKGCPKGWGKGNMAVAQQNLVIEQGQSFQATVRSLTTFGEKKACPV